MTAKEQAIKTLLEPEYDPEQLARVEEKLDLLLSALVVQQKDACVIAGVSPDTVRKKALDGTVEILSSEGSRKNYVTLKTTADLQKRTAIKRRISKPNG